MATATTYYHCAQRTSYQSQHKYEHYQEHDYNPASLQVHTTYYLNTQTFNSRRPYSFPSAPISSRRSAEEEDLPSRTHRIYYSAASEPSVMAPSSPPPSLGKDNAVCSASHSHHSQLQQHHRQSLQYPPPPHQRRAHLDEGRLPYHPPHQHPSYDERQQFLRPDRSYYQEEHRHSNRASPPSGSSPSLSTSSISTASFASSPSPKSLPTALSSPRVPPSFRAAPQRDTGREDRHLLQDEQLGWNNRPLDHGSNAAQPHSRPRSKSAVAFMDTHMPMSRTSSSSSAVTAVEVVHRPPKPAMDGRGSAKGRRPGAKVNNSVSPQQSKRSPSFRKYMCPEPGCGAPCDSIASLIQHQSKHTGSEKGKSKCPWPDCDKVLATPKSLKDHLQIHEERDANLKLPCPVQGCDKVFGTNRCLRAHELRCKQVKSGERLPCPIEGCPFTFGSTDYVRRHVLDHEKGLIGQEFLCDHPGCNAILANPLTLQRHKQLHEEQSLGFEWRCLVKGCGKIYSGSKQLTDHQSRIHKDLDSSYRFLCPYNTCRKTFECQRSAYKHACLHERTKCPLEGCICVLPSKEALDAHLWMHETLKTRPPYPCFEEGCSKVFDTKNDILAHALTHKIES